VDAGERVIQPLGDFPRLPVAHRQRAIGKPQLRNRGDHRRGSRTEDLLQLASRVRALDWLAARGLAPAGYDPLGDPAQRRAALEKDAEARAAAPEGAR